MKKKLRWNNQRRTISYWVAILLKLAVFFNIASHSFIEQTIGLRNLNDLLEIIYRKILSQTVCHSIQHILLLNTMILFCLIGFILILVFNTIVGLIPSINVFHHRGKYQFLGVSTVIADIILGIILEVLDIVGFLTLKDHFRSTSIVFILYGIMFMIGSILYWRRCLPILKIAKFARKIENGNNTDEVIICVSNTNIKVSPFSSVPRPQLSTVINVEDLSLFPSLRIEQFRHFAILIDSRAEIDENTKRIIQRIMICPHALPYFVLFGNQDNEQNRIFISSLKSFDDLKIKQYTEASLSYWVDINDYVSQKDFCVKCKKEIPLGFINNEILLATYFTISNSPKLCMRFLHMILNDLETLPAIYALFDYIDLQYRIKIALSFHPDTKWMKQNSRKIGNIALMSSLVESANNSTERERYSLTLKDVKELIATQKYQRLIHKYLPNFEIDENKSVYDAVVYLTAALRSVLRGHGSFDAGDAIYLFELVFQIALINSYYLAINDIEFHRTEIPFLSDENTTYYRVSAKMSSKEIDISPFIIATKDSNYFIFNNFDKEYQVEYINYLDGTLILPKYEQLTLSDSDVN